MGNVEFLEDKYQEETARYARYKEIISEKGFAMIDEFKQELKEHISRNEGRLVLTVDLEGEHYIYWIGMNRTQPSNNGTKEALLLDFRLFGIEDDIDEILGNLTEDSLKIITEV